MKILVTGARGQLGYDVVRHLEKNSNDVVLGIDRKEIDIINKQSVNNVVSSFLPDIIIHCAAYTAVDRAEDDEENCKMTNVQGTANIVDAAIKINAKILYISTDYIFNGEKETPYDTFDEADPKSIYGITKYLGEKEIQRHKKHFIVRISWVFGANGSNFVKSILKKARETNEISVVSDQIGSPTYTKDLAILIGNIIETDKYGIYHATNEGFCSWFEFAKYFLEKTNTSINVKPILTKDYNTIAKRPLNSRLSKKSLDENGFERLPSWHDAITRFLEEIGEKII